MNVASRTPEGEPFQCDICGEMAFLDVSEAGDMLCPACGQLLWRFKQLFAKQLNVSLEQIARNVLESDIAGDSLDTVEIVMALEEEWPELLEESDLDQIHSLRDAIALLRRRQWEKGNGDFGG